jgi:hypothetical protein
LNINKGSIPGIYLFDVIYTDSSLFEVRLRFRITLFKCFIPTASIYLQPNPPIIVERDDQIVLSNDLKYFIKYCNPTSGLIYNYFKVTYEIYPAGVELVADPNLEISSWSQNTKFAF